MWTLFSVLFLHGCLDKEKGYALLDYKSDWHYRKSGTARLQSPKITDPVCIKFFFRLHGNEAGMLKIETYNIITGKSRTIFDRYGNHGVTWQTGQLYINITGDYKVCNSACSSTFVLAFFFCLLISFYFTSFLPSFKVFVFILAFIFLFPLLSPFFIITLSLFPHSLDIY